MRSECEDTRPKALSSVTMDQLILCLQFAIERMKVPNVCDCLHVSISIFFIKTYKSFIYLLISVQGNISEIYQCYETIGISQLI